jgi:hypothetical protein
MELRPVSINLTEAYPMTCPDETNYINTSLHPASIFCEYIKE